MIPRSAVRVFCLLLVLSQAVLAQPNHFRQISAWVSEGRFKEAAEELQRISLEAGRSLKPPDPVEQKVLNRAVRTSRTYLREKHPPAELDAARQVLCLARAYLTEELPATQTPLRVGEDGRGVQPPVLIGEKRYPKIPEVARRAGIRGVEIVEVVIDEEGCVRNSRVLRMLPMGLDVTAATAVRSWTFRPAMLEGRPVPVYYVLTIPFPARK